MTIVPHHDLRTCPVIGKKEDEGVIKRIHSPKLVDDTADIAVHPVDHGGVNGHFDRLESALLFRPVFPGEGPVDLSGAEDLQGFREMIRRPHFAFHLG